MPSNYEYDTQPMVRSAISIVACVIIGAILLFAGLGKLAEFGTIPGQTDFLDKFLNSNHVFFLYMRGGQPYRTIKALFPFQSAFKQLLETALKKSN